MISYDTEAAAEAEAFCEKFDSKSSRNLQYSSCDDFL